MASTYGPSVPEVAKFEPAEAKELVNLYSGDFIYTLPLFEVPGPGGGYPVVLSYKAGIPVEDEASWVGLGWNINVGAIHRSVAGLPDDQCGGKILYKSKDYFGANVSAGYGPAQVGLHYDNYGGLSSNFNFSLPYGMGIGLSSSGASVSVGNFSIHQQKRVVLEYRFLQVVW
jgi:hypothetical protein